MRLNRWIVKLTARRWNWLINHVLCRAYSNGVITSAQLHTLAREFDPTQDGTVGRICENRQVEPYAFDPKAA